MTTPITRSTIYLYYPNLIGTSLVTLRLPARAAALALSLFLPEPPGFSGGLLCLQ